MGQLPKPGNRSGLDITSDIFVYEDPKRIQKTLTGLLGAFFLGSVAILILSLAVGWGVTIRLTLGSTIAFAAIFIIHRRGHPREASLLALITLGAVSLVGVATGDGIHDAAIALLPIIIALGSIVLSPPLFYTLTTLILVSILTIGTLEYQGIISNKYQGMWIPADIVILFLISGAGAVVMRLLTVGLNDNLVRAHNSERNYREIFNTSSDAIFIHDAATGDILDVNERTFELFGFSREELENSAIEIMVTDVQPFTLENARAHMRKTVEEGPQVFEWRCRRKGGDNIWVEVSLRLTEIGGEKRILAQVRDIDDRKRMEEQLLQAEKLQAVGTLAGGVAHDFNNQLTGIIGWTDLIRDRITDNPDLETATSNILTSAKRASDLTAQLLAFARKGKFESKPLDVHLLIKEVTELLAHTIDKRISIETRLEAEAPFTTGDPSQLQNAVLNLGVNARDSMPQGGRMLFATRNLDLDRDQEKCRRWKLEPGPFVEISVSDTGDGMDALTLKSIWEPFFTTKKATKGTGLGLSSVYGTVNNHQGCIDVSSTPGEGSTFRILLPVGRRPDSTGSANEPHQARGTGRILVIDDEEILIKTVSAILRKEGYETVTCTDSSEGLEVFRFSPEEFDLILLDMIMPGMNGPEVFSALREIDPEVAVLLMSGATANYEVQQLADAGARGFLPKPFHARDLRQAVEACWLERS